MISFANKVSLITGASSGIGRATAILFSNLGSKLVLVGRNGDELDKTIELCGQTPKSENIVKVTGDLGKLSLCDRIVDEGIKRFGKLDMLVNNAAIFHLGSMLGTSMESFDEQMNVNMKSVFYLTKLCVPHLIREKGSIVNVSSIAGSRSFPNLIAYSMSKAAIDQMTRCLALELAKDQVRVNSVNPGVIITKIHKRAGYDDAQYKAFLEHCKQTHALGRPGEASEVASVIAFLASDKASFTTGEIVHVDGGRHAMSPR